MLYLPLKDPPLLTLFFYGTLKQGRANHERFCRGYLSVEEATARGRLYHLPTGYPALVVPKQDVRAVGTADPTRDALQQRFGHPRTLRLDDPRVFGELFTFEDPAERLPALDRLEGFDPGAERSLYRRVLIPVETSGGTCLLAWTYAIREPRGTYLPGGRWPPGVAGTDRTDYPSTGSPL